MKKNVHLQFRQLLGKSKSQFNLFKTFQLRTKTTLEEKIIHNDYKVNIKPSLNIEETKTNNGDKIVEWAKLFSRDFQFEIKKPLPELTNTSKFKTVIFDINKVLLRFDKLRIKAVENELKMILKNPIWLNYLNGTLKKEEAIEKISDSLKFSKNDVEKIIDVARECLSPIEENVNFLQKLKQQRKRLICLSNCPKDEIEIVRRRFDFFDNFEVIISSGDIGVNKPHPDAFNFVLNYCNLRPEETIYLDDDVENIETAKSLGINSFVYKGYSSLQQIQNLLNKESVQNKDDNLPLKVSISPYSESFSKSFNYITKSADLDEYGLFVGIVGLGEQLKNAKQSPSEMFASAVMLSMSKQITLSPIGNRIISMMKNVCNNGKFKFFIDLDVIPYDCDTTSLALSLLYKNNLIDEKIVHAGVDAILANHNGEKIILTYFDNRRYRVCPIVCSNALYLIYLVGKENNLVVKNTKRYILNFLRSKEYCDGCTYYPNPDFFLFSVSKLVHKFPEDFSDFKSVLVNELKERIGKKDDPLSLACRVICCNLFDIPNDEEFNKLLNLQLEDGSWPESPIYSTSKKKEGDVYYWANRGFSTAFGMKAVEMKIFGNNQF